MKKSIVAVLTVAFLLVAGASLAGMNKPEMVTVSGKVIDITCTAKGRAMMGKWGNAQGDTHMTPDGEKKACATMCLKGGQPAGLFDGDQISAVLACNPRATLSDYAAQDVDLQGFWAGGPNDAAKSFVPTKIRSKGDSEWKDVNCATMHG